MLKTHGPVVCRRLTGLVTLVVVVSEGAKVDRLNRSIEIVAPKVIEVPVVALLKLVKDHESRCRHGDHFSHSEWEPQTEMGE